MTTMESIAFAIFLVMTVGFFGWVVWLWLRKHPADHTDV